MSTATVVFLTAEMVLVAAAIIIYLGGAMVRTARPWAWIAGAGIVLAAAALWQWGGERGHGSGAGGRDSGAEYSNSEISNLQSEISKSQIPNSKSLTVGPVTTDPLAHYGRWLALAFGAVLVLIAGKPLATGGNSEYLGSLLLVIAGLMLAAGAGDLVLLFVGLELISIPTYILLYMGRRDAASQEAAAKYFFLSVLASAMFLYGLSFLYGTAGSTNMAVIREKLSHLESLPAGFGMFARLALVLVFAGLCFRISAVPFHFYAPDVYQGTIHANAGLLSVVPKAAGFLALVRVALVTMPGVSDSAWRIALALAVITMTLGNVVALWQDNIRRLLAYSSIANAGYMLIGLAVGLATAGSSGAGGRWDGVGGLLFYLSAYAAGTLGIFAALAYLGRQRQQIEALDELAGLGRTHPLVAGAIALCLFSLTGLPPAGGLWGKIMVFGSALNVQAGTGGPLRSWFIGLAIIGVLNAAVAAFYYLRIVGVMYFRAPSDTPRAEGGHGAWMATMACALVVLCLGVYPGPLIHASNMASPAVESSGGGVPTSGIGRQVVADPKSEVPNLKSHL
jgi:NADH-quinone oxidoreductase subunit N